MSVIESRSLSAEVRLEPQARATSDDARREAEKQVASLRQELGQARRDAEKQVMRLRAEASEARGDTEKQVMRLEQLLEGARVEVDMLR